MKKSVNDCYHSSVASSNSSRAEGVVTKLRKGIFEGRYPPGTALREMLLARELGVSQATVREALQRLEFNGLVTRRPNVGSTVTRLAPRDVRERVQLRAMLEVKAALDASVRMSENEFQELEHRLDALQAAVDSDRYYEAAQADLDFHRFIWVCSGNETLARHLELLTVPLFAFISILRSQGLERLVTVVEAHQPLITALRSRDPAKIRIEFAHAATSAYTSFTGEGMERAVLAAFGLLEPETVR